eukprot:CAMPEP_0196772814 /NCGR_PEP_ID=MMETSP1104-20130614/2435_1 /TAXON_ID=33652 /ORGANISM="Cafeteria sp., Strain Caron Lab Isolate" /LENGTH=152 /DNA_ID=CAMNT_0042142957 /DNA_START=408 /DNA_END=863 /DNA_ORIENTATION=-
MFNSFALNSILERLDSRDKDFRFMAAKDLLEQLQSVEDGKLDIDSANRIRSALVGRLKDQHGDVSDMALACYGPLVAKIGHAVVINDVCDSAFEVMGSEEHVDVAAAAMKRVLQQLPSTPFADVVTERVVPNLLRGTSTSVSAQMQFACLEL